MTPADAKLFARYALFVPIACVLEFWVSFMGLEGVGS